MYDKTTITTVISFHVEIKLLLIPGNLELLQTVLGSLAKCTGKETS
jgi:hypothetical protein